jgi:hypothetical protein
MFLLTQLGARPESDDRALHPQTYQRPGALLANLTRDSIHGKWVKEVRRSVYESEGRTKTTDDYKRNRHGRLITG